ncbi:MAG: hypothetical protein HQ463_03580 [Bacteroidetes bacterium]|nr:hypothetical protein [Bacteroidota bacterium]
MRIYILILFAILVKNGYCQNNTLKNQLLFDTVLCLKTNQFTNNESFNVKYDNEFVYILGANHLPNNADAILLKININNYTIDTFFININKFSYYYQNISDFNIRENNLYLFNSSEFCIYNLKDNNHYYHEVPKNLKQKYTHFSIKDSTVLYLFEWQIGNILKENKNIIAYNLKDKQTDKVLGYELNGLHILATNPSKKYIEVNSNCAATMNPNEYKIRILNMNTGKQNLIERNLDTSLFIDRKILEDLNLKYLLKPTYNILDSLSNYENNRTQLNALKLYNDSILIISYQNIIVPCQWNKMNVPTYFDIWKLNKVSNNWQLYKNDIRIDNNDTCKKFSWLSINKTRLPFNSAEKWLLTDNKLVLFKLISNKLELNSKELGKQYYDQQFQSNDKYMYLILYKF